jgi:hypothetical protein
MEPLVSILMPAFNAEAFVGDERLGVEGRNENRNQGLHETSCLQ